MWKNIVVGVDDEDSSTRALERAADIARMSHAALVVASITPALVGMAAAHGVGPYDPADPPEAHRDELRHAREFLAEMKVPARFELGLGEPAEQIVALAERHAADLIVVGTREPDFLERLISGSVSQAVARKAHCDVLIVH